MGSNRHRKMKKDKHVCIQFSCRWKTLAARHHRDGAITAYRKDHPNATLEEAAHAVAEFSKRLHL